MNITGERLRLYAVTDRTWAADEEALFRQIGAAIDGGASVVQLREKYAFTAENVDDILRDEVGRVFAQVLEHAGVYRRDAQGQAAFLRFLETVK